MYIRLEKLNYRFGDDMMNSIERKISDIVINYLKNNDYNYVDLRNTIILELHPFINNLTGRRPTIIPVIMEIKNKN